MKVDELEVVLRRQGSFYKDVHVILGSVYYLYSRVSPLLSYLNLDENPTMTTTGDIPHPQSSSPMVPSPPSETESKLYYYGLPSRPPLVARSSTTPWKEPTGSEAYCEAKELRPVYNHALQEVWKAGLAREVIAVLDSMEVKFTSIDIVRIGIPEQSHFPVIIWIGVTPGSLSGEDGVVVVSKCRGLLEKHDITDVDVEIRESEVWPSYRSLR